MKTLHALLIPLISTQLIYAEKKEIILPKNIQSKLCQKLLNQGCTKQKSLVFDNIFKLDNNQLLLFSHIEHKDSLYAHGYKNIPLIVDMKNNWKIINNNIEAEIQNVLRDPYGGIWIHALWMIEGVSPLLYYSKDGLKWKQIRLPKEEGNHGTFEDLEVCFLKESIQLRFNNLDNTEETKVWDGQYQLVLNKNPLWQKVNDQAKSRQKCSKTSANNNHWTIKESNNKNVLITLMNKEQAKSTPLPKQATKEPTPKNIIEKKDSKTATIHFSLQLGTFQQKSSMDKLYKQMSNIPDALIQREFIINGERVNKVFIGYFKNYEEAKNKLISLRKKYPNNIIFKNAFITKLK